MTYTSRANLIQRAMNQPFRESRRSDPAPEVEQHLRVLRVETFTVLANVFSPFHHRYVFHIFAQQIAVDRVSPMSSHELNRFAKAYHYDTYDPKTIDFELADENPYDPRVAMWKYYNFFSPVSPF